MSNELFIFISGLKFITNASQLASSEKLMKIPRGEKIPGVAMEWRFREDPALRESQDPDSVHGFGVKRK